MNRATDDPASLEQQIGPRGQFSLRQAGGDIVLRGVEGDRARVRTADGRPLDEIFDIDAAEGRLELRQKERFGFGLKMFRGSPDLEVEVPHGASISIDSASADLQASDLDGRKQFRTASGDARLLRLAGVVEVQTVSGDIELEGQAIVELGLRSVSGDIRVRVPRLRRIEMSTTSGDLWLDAELAGDGPFALRSISGDATIVGRAGIRVEAESITGDLSSELPSKRETAAGRKVLTVGRPGATLAFKSVSGDLRVVRPRDAAIPVAPDAPAPPRSPAEASPSPATVAPDDDNDATRLEILRELERGDITVAEATDRLARLDEVPR